MFPCGATEVQLGSTDADHQGVVHATVTWNAPCPAPASTCAALRGTWQTYDDAASGAEGRSSCWRSVVADQSWPLKCGLLVSGAHQLTSRAAAGQGLLGAVAAAGRGDGWVGAKGSRLSNYAWADSTGNANIRRAGGSRGSAWAATFPK
jgi:hypothetical protein